MLGDYLRFVEKLNLDIKMNKKIVTSLLLLPLFLFAKESELSSERIYKKSLSSVVRSCPAIDSLYCSYIEKNRKLEVCRESIDNLSKEQIDRINLAISYGGADISYIGKNEKESFDTHPKRVTFKIYDKYFNKLASGELALELTVTTSTTSGRKYIYLLKKSDKKYKISYLIGEIEM